MGVSKGKRRNGRPHKFNSVSWSTSVVVEMDSERSYVYLMGGCNFEKRTVSTQNLEVITETGYVAKLQNLPRPKFAHAACLAGVEIVITGGISDLMHNMGMRNVPVADRECFAYDYFRGTWRNLPDLPAGKMHPTLVAINGRFIFQIGGFEDINFEIYRLDMQNSHRPWKMLTLDLTKPIVDRDFYRVTRNYVQEQINLNSFENRGSDDDSDVRENFGNIVLASSFGRQSDLTATFGMQEPQFVKQTTFMQDNESEIDMMDEEAEDAMIDQLRAEHDDKLQSVCDSLRESMQDD